MLQARSLRHKLMAIVLVSTLVALLTALGTVIAFEVKLSQRDLAVELDNQAELLGQMSAAELRAGDQPRARSELQRLRARAGITAAALYDAGGRLFAGYQAVPDGVALPQQAGTAGMHNAHSGLELFRPIVADGRLLGTVYLRAEDGMAGRMADYVLLALAVTVLGLLVALLLLRRLDHVITQPVNEILAEAELRARQLQESNQELAREAAQRELAQQEVMRLNQELEARVHERTMALELANGELAVAIQEARSANSAKSAFLSSMSHELRTPLNAILGFAQILSSDRLPSTLEQKKEFAGHILKSGRHLLTLINEILDLAKVESGAVSLTLEAVELHEMIDECRDMIGPLASERDIRVAFPATCQLCVLADRTRLRQILLNLLSNALKYNREHGQVTLECAMHGERMVRISVRDTGLGLDTAQQALLFQPFNRLGQEGGAEEGSGIGLVVTKRLVELMDGEIGVHSVPGEGCTFWIELRLAPPAAGQAAVLAPHAHGAADAATATLLYVEDNPANVALVGEIMRHCPQLRLLTARDGESGLALARSELPAMILLDINLPGMSGTEVLKLLRQDARTAPIPVIALTANAMAHDIERSMALGFYRYLTKPLELDTFCETVNSTLAHLARQGRQKGEP